MKLKTEKAIKFWISTAFKLCAILFLLVRGYDYFFSEDEEKIDPSTTKNTITIPTSTDLNSPKDSMTTLSTQTTDPKKVSKKPTAAVQLSETIRFRGNPLPNARVIIEDCTECRISRTTDLGLLTISVPRKVYDQNYLHNFYVYSNDSLLFERAMRFTDLQFNIY